VGIAVELPIEDVVVVEKEDLLLLKDPTDIRRKFFDCKNQHSLQKFARNLGISTSE
jgi:recombinational DNA repair ATPase RecF